MASRTVSFCEECFLNSMNTLSYCCLKLHCGGNLWPTLYTIQKKIVFMALQAMHIGGYCVFTPLSLANISIFVSLSTNNDRNSMKLVTGNHYHQTDELVTFWENKTKEQ